PSTTFAPGVGVAYYPVSALRVEASIVRALEQTATVSGQKLGGNFRLTAIDARACWSLVDDEISAGPCAGLEIANVDADGYGSFVVSTRSVTWAGPTGGALVRWAATR